MRNFLSIQDVADPMGLANEGLALKASPYRWSFVGRYKTLALVFFNPSLRTRLSTEKAGLNLGMQVMNLNAADGWKLEFETGAVMDGDKAEHVKEAAGVISQYADVIGIRSFPGLADREKDYQDEVIRQFVRYAKVPVISLESATRHPLQSLTDLMTIMEYQKTEKPKVVLSWAPHPKALPQAVPNSFVEWMRRAEVDLVLTHPVGYELAPEFAGGLTVQYDPDKAFEGADFVYAKNWSAYEPYGTILSQDPAWRVTERRMQLTNNARFMHCLPVRRNVIVDDKVLDGPNSLILEQANNRTYAAMAVLKKILESN